MHESIQAGLELRVLQVQMPAREPTSSISWDLSEHYVCERSVAPRRISAERGDGIQADARIVAPFLFTIDVGHLHASNHASQARGSKGCVVAGIFSRGKSVLVARGTHADRNVKKDSEGKGTRRYKREGSCLLVPCMANL